MKSKAELRKEILKLRDALELEVRQEKSKKIAKMVTEQKSFQEADKILLFASHKSEVDTTEIFQTARGFSKDVYYPKVQGKEMEFYQVQEKDELQEGYRGIREPEANPKKQFKLNTNEKVLIFMPGAVFDEEGNRIGYGGGYYDKYLQHLKKFMSEESICKMALAFECQIVVRGQIKIEDHDIFLDIIVTEDRVILIKPNS